MGHCIDYIFRSIDKLVGNSSRLKLLSFKDVYPGYNQIHIGGIAMENYF